MEKENNHFNLDQIILDLKHYLPSQAPLKDFIHHNTLHSFQNALIKANRIFGYKTYLRFDEYKVLFQKHEISEEIIKKVIREKKGEENSEYWYSQMLNASDISYSLPRIGSLRDQWKSIYSFDLDAIVHPFLFRLIANYLDQTLNHYWKNWMIKEKR